MGGCTGICCTVVDSAPRSGTGARASVSLIRSRSLRPRIPFRYGWPHASASLIRFHSPRLSIPHTVPFPAPPYPSYGSIPCASAPRLVPFPLTSAFIPVLVPGPTPCFFPLSRFPLCLALHTPFRYWCLAPPCPIQFRALHLRFRGGPCGAPYPRPAGSEQRADEGHRVVPDTASRTPPAHFRGRDLPGVPQVALLAPIQIGG